MIFKYDKNFCYFYIIYQKKIIYQFPIFQGVGGGETNFKVNLYAEVVESSRLPFHLENLVNLEKKNRKLKKNHLINKEIQDILKLKNWKIRRILNFLVFYIPEIMVSLTSQAVNDHKHSISS